MSFAAHGLGNTPMYRPRVYCRSGNLYLKLENANPVGSIKDRTAYYMIKELLDTGRLKPGIKLVESSSGNLGLALGHFTSELGIPFMCLVDPTIPPDKLSELKGAGVQIHVVSLGSSPDYRTARIQMAHDLDQQSDWIWTNQYDNPANFRAHYETTGPEIWSQTKGCVNYVVCSVGTGGTICGIGHSLKQRNPSVRVVAVEPEGSTIFGGTPGKYLSVGAGMRHPSGIFEEYGQVVDYYCKISDRNALQECVNILHIENLSVGVTAGSVLVVASWLATHHPNEIIVAVVPDGGEEYAVLTKGIMPHDAAHDVTLVEYSSDSNSSE